MCNGDFINIRSVKSALRLLLCCVLARMPLSSASDKTLEVSFGTSQMLVDEVDRLDIKDQSKVILPTTSALFIAEYLWNAQWGSLMAFNLPLNHQKFLVNDELIEETASNTYLFGQRYTPTEWSLKKTAILSPQFSVLLSGMSGDTLQWSPSVAARLHVRDDSGFSMYLGAIVTYSIKGYVLFYGIGHQF